MRVWFCTLCRDNVQIGKKPDACPGCRSGEDLRPLEVPYEPDGRPCSYCDGTGIVPGYEGATWVQGEGWRPV